MATRILLLLVLVVPALAKTDCKKDFSDCKEGGKCMKNAMDPAGGLYCLEIQEISASCKCTCGLITDCDKHLTTPPPTTPAPTTAATTPAPTTAAPTEAPEEKKKEKSSSCFTGDSIVQTAEGPKSIEEIAGRRDIKLRVLDDDGNYQMADIWFWNHVDRAAAAKFLRLTTESGRTLEVTEEHLTLITPCMGMGGQGSAKFAKHVQPGECVIVANGEHAKIEKIRDIDIVSKIGVYSFVTETGNVFVNDVMVSCFNTFENQDIQRLAYSMLKTVINWMPGKLSSLFYDQLKNPEPWMRVIDHYSVHV